MFRPMRRARQALSPEACAAILARGTAGVLATCGDDGYPYAVPLSYVYHEGTLYFHCARDGHKLDAIARSDKVSFCVIDRDDVIPEAYTTHFASVICFGRARPITDPAEKRRALHLLAERYCPEQAEGHQREIDRFWEQTAMVAVTVEHMTGKQAVELVTET